MKIQKLIQHQLGNKLKNTRISSINLERSCAGCTRKRILLINQGQKSQRNSRQNQSRLGTLSKIVVRSKGYKTNPQPILNRQRVPLTIRDWQILRDHFCINEQMQEFIRPRTKQKLSGGSSQELLSAVVLFVIFLWIISSCVHLEDLNHFFIFDFSRKKQIKFRIVYLCNSG